MNTPFLIGIDMGTTNAKAIACDKAGNLLATHSVGYSVQYPQPDWAEQDPDEIVAAALECIHKVYSTTKSYGPLLGISFSSAMHSLVALTEQGQPLTKLIIWADNRSADIADALRPTAIGKEMYRRNGTPIHAMTPACKLRWLHEHQPVVFRRAAKFVGIKEYLFYKLTGKYLIDYSVASATGLFNIRELRWDAWTLDQLRLEISQLSEPVSPFHVQELPSSEVLSLPAGTPLVIGASDGCLANLGSGATDPGTMAITIGTSGAARISAPRAYSDDQMRTFCYLLEEQTYIIGGATNNGAIIFQWLKDTFFANETYEQVFARAEAIEPGADGLVFLPYLLGERAPLWDSHVRGGFAGLGIRHTQAHFVRAVMEGIILNLYSIGKILMEQQPIHTVYANGGFTQSTTWVQLLADVFGKPIALNETAETGAMGAMMMGLKALGHIREYDEVPQFTPVARTVEPNWMRHRGYQLLAARFEQWVKTVTREYPSTL
ncbi:gluconokinase [Rhabdobacter roseus]|uniref:Gluconokinase n=1 Tax=Rhabdobacter roseus TaxID=1655419 RepID=A0A840TN47_9BACT|nr:gluconokinase [Rhabdobacter roseus]MBB5285696.1 gluconokinase [Rhabdobacter roseus]